MKFKIITHKEVVETNVFGKPAIINTYYMTRKEEIIQAARQKEKEVGFTQIVLDAKGVNSAYGIGFLEGAEWADKHPASPLR